jgi:hypothetical protein
MIPLDDEISLSSVGSDLLSHAQEFGSPDRLPVTTRLFPYLLLASRRMTTREMSAWLDKEKGVKLSAPMITKGLNRPDLHLGRIAAFVEPLAAFITAVYHASGETPKSLLYGKDPQTGRAVLDEMDEMTWHAPDGRSDSVTEAFGSLREVWDPIPEEVKWMCLPYFDFNAELKDSASSTPETHENEPNET